MSATPTTPSALAVLRYLQAEGHAPSLVEDGRTFLAIAPTETIVTPPGAGAGLMAIPPRLVHGAHGRGLWIGAIAYDAAFGLLGIGTRHAFSVPTVIAAYHPTYAVLDDAGWSVVGADGDAYEVLLRATTAAPAPAARPRAEPRLATSSATRAEHATACREAQRLIALGEAFEVNLAHVLSVPWTDGGLDLYERLTTESRGAHGAYLALGGVEIASVSPELFLRIDGNRCETRPIKGTRQRSSDPVEDAALAADLVGSEKDRAENLMIVDLLRNDLTATAEPASVRVEALCLLERTASVMHLVSVVTSRVRAGIRQPDVLVSCFPGGSITGAPKRRSIELIDQLERAPRGFYCGSVFAWEPAAARLTASIAIRTATVTDGVARYGAGGAVTLLSDADEEAEETIIKARPFLNATNATPVGW